MNDDAKIAKILIVDDDPFMLKVVGRALAKLDFEQVISCESGCQALVMLEEETPVVDLILCDLNMPEMDGVEFIRHLAERRYPSALILISGEDVRILQTAEKLARTHQLTVLGHLQKPVDPEKLKRLIDLGATRPDAKPNQPNLARPVVNVEELRQAIFGGELVNFYQPQVIVATRQVIGVESLVRWRHPRDGWVGPNRFIRVAERHGLIDDLTQCVVAQAVIQASAWRDLGLPLKVAINISMDNLSRLNFPEFMAAQVAAADVNPANIVLEITESRLMKDPLKSLDILARLRLKRFSLSIDDFGTGYSTMAQLRDIPFDELKIDRGFVHGASRDSFIRVIFAASQRMAEQLGMRIVAEGVEDQEDWDYIANSSCHLAQGYYIAKPMPAAELPNWIERWNAGLNGSA